MDFCGGRRRDLSAPGWVCDSAGSSAPSGEDPELALGLRESGLLLQKSLYPSFLPLLLKTLSSSASLCACAAVMVTLIMVIRKEKSSMCSVSSLPSLCEQDRCTCIEIPALKAAVEGTRLELGGWGGWVGGSAVVLVKAKAAYENVPHPPAHTHWPPCHMHPCSSPQTHTAEIYMYWHTHACIHYPKQKCNFKYTH